MAVDRPHPVRVGIDGFSAAGKTTLADELTSPIEESGRSALRASLDDFKLPVVRRGRYPSGTPEEYYYEMYDHQAIRRTARAPRPGRQPSVPYSDVRPTVTGRRPRDAGNSDG